MTSFIRYIRETIGLFTFIAIIIIAAYVLMFAPAGFLDTVPKHLKWVILILTFGGIGYFARKT